MMKFQRFTREATESFKQPYVLATLVLLGAESTLSQVYLTREALVVLEGNELILAMLLGVWLVGVAIGAWLSRAMDRAGIGCRTLLVVLIPPLMLSVAVAVLRVSHVLLDRLPGQPLTPLQTVGTIVTAVLPVSGACGALFPMLTGLIPTDSGTAVGKAFTWDALGSVLAGVLLSFLLLPALNPFLAIFGLLFVGLGMVAVAYRSMRSLVCLAGVFVLAAAWLGLPHWLDAETNASRWRVMHPGLERVTSLESRYQHLDLAYQENQWTIFGNGLPLFSFPDDYLLAPFVHFSLSQTPRPRSVLLLSDRSWWLIPYLREHGIERIISCTMDPTIERLVENEPRIQLPSLQAAEIVCFSDPRAFVSRLPSAETFDCIFVDQPDPSTALLNRMYTVEWFEMISRHLSERGVCVFSVTGTPVTTEADTGRFGASLYETLRSVFADVLLVPAQTWTFFASNSKGMLQPNLAAVIERWKHSGIVIPTFPPEMLSLYYQSSTIENLNRQIQAMPAVPLNTDARPFVYAGQLSLWFRRAGVSDADPWWLAAPAAALLGLGMMLWIVLVYKRKSHCFSLWPAAWMLGASGMLTMGVEWMLLVIYQSRIGCLYQSIGLFFGIFMLGLALGGFAGLRLTQRLTQSAVPWLIGIDLLLIAIAFSTPLIELLIPVRGTGPALVIVLMWLALTSIAAGIQFPIISYYLGQSSPGTPRLAALLEGVDHAGGALGAPIVALAVLPWMGLFWACVVLAAIKMVFLIVFLTTRPMDRSILPE